MSNSAPVVLSTTSVLHDHEVVVHHGVVAASTVLAPTSWIDARAWGRMLVGGKVKAHIDLTDGAIVDAVERLRHDARATGANAVIGVAFETTQLRDGLMLIVSGTAVSVTEAGAMAHTVADLPPAVRALLVRQAGVAARRQLLRRGMTPAEVDRARARAGWTISTRATASTR